MASARSRITKGREFQKRVFEKFKKAFSLPEDDTSRTPIGAESGEDIKWSKEARAIIGLSCECKDKKNLGVWAALEQAKKNCPKECTESVIFKRGDLGSHKTYIIVPFDHYLEIREKLRKWEACLE